MEDTIELPRGQVKIMVGYIEKARDMFNNLLSISEQIFYKCLENTSNYYYPGEKMYELIESVKKKLEK